MDAGLGRVQFQSVAARHDSEAWARALSSCLGDGSSIAWVTVNTTCGTTTVSYDRTQTTGAEVKRACERVAARPATRPEGARRRVVQLLPKLLPILPRLLALLFLL